MILSRMMDIAEKLYISGEFLWDALGFSMRKLLTMIHGQFSPPAWVDQYFPWLLDSSLLDILFVMTAAFLVIGIIKWVTGIFT